MHRHTQIGYQLLAGSTSKLLDAAAVVALSHHEWWDGGGYPSGVSGDDIPELGRIAAIANVFDALTSNRADHPALELAEAVAAMRDLRGRQFEPRLLDAFLGLTDDIATILDAHLDRADAPARIRVLLVDDDARFVENLAGLLAAHPAIRVVGTAASVNEAEQAAVAYEPEVILMDLELPGADGIAATARIRALRPAGKIVMLTGRMDHRAFARAIGAGAAGFVTKTASVDQLVGAIRAAHEGDDLPPVTDLPVLLHGLSSTRRGLGGDLRPRELEVLGLVATGLPNKAIAERLFISLNTVRNHVQRILSKLDAHSRLEAVATAVREGLIARDDESTSAG
jgi:DNA-binding NarL/FixJ family response regulator